MECQREQVKRLGVLGETVVFSVLKALPKETCYRVFMNNFFTSFRLVEVLATNNIRASGTMRENGLGDCTISKKKAIDKFDRGVIELLELSTLIIESCCCCMERQQISLCSFKMQYSRAIISSAAIV